MTSQPLRLPENLPHGLSGTVIDRSRPLSFRLNGRTVHGFAGDTVLSAALANGIQSAGRQRDTPLALDETFAPLITSRQSGLLPMDRTPALDGAEFTTIGVRRDVIANGGVLGQLRLRLLGPARTLNHRYGDVPPVPEPWRSAAVEEHITADFAIVGAGVAGLAAAAAASAAGRSVVLIERNDTIGGAVRFFGAVEGEESPDATLASLAKGLDSSSGVTRLTRAEAFQLDGTTIRLHQIVVDNNALRSRVIAVDASHIILATGALERLPIFPGNRTPGIVGALAAHQRAYRYGVWGGPRVIVSTPHGHAYRLALHASDAGLPVQRIVDTRLNPTSRFVDFAKASGITLASGLVVSHAEQVKRNQPELRIGFAVPSEKLAQDAQAIETDQLVAAGSWQPDLGLWLSAGGSVGWNGDGSCLVHRGTRPNVSLVGAAAGFCSTTGAIGSARAAVSAAIGKTAPEFEDIRIDSAFETPDAPVSVAPQRLAGPAYLDRGVSLVTRRSAAPELAHRPVALSLSDIAAAVQIGAIAVRDAGPVAEQRCGVSGDIVATDWQLPSPDAAADGLPEPPAYLVGRFGADAAPCLVAASEARHFEAGCLIFEGSEQSDPLRAAGVVYAAAPGGAPGGVALLGAQAQSPEAALYLRDTSSAIPIRVTERFAVEK